MIYREFRGEKLSALGFGAMRLPVIDGKDRDVDIAATQEMVDYAMNAGINYYDCGWSYHGGSCESIMGSALKKYPRESYHIVTKYPGYDLSTMSKAPAVFAKQLENCQVDSFDFYLLHNVCELNIEAYLDTEKYGVVEYILEQQKAGKIKHLGFSTHAQIPVMKRFLEKYGQYMEFCQIQLNWLDWTFQEAKAKVELLSSYNIPVWVMEPLRGGKLAKLSAEDEAVLKALRPEEDIPAWAFRFMQSIPEVTVTLSGMSSLEQLKANIATYEAEKPLTEQEMAALMQIADKMQKAKTLPCTACHYCTNHCPKNLDIPYLMSLYNEHILTGGGFIAPMAMVAVDKEHWPDVCLHCHSCEQVCPQQIKISDMMEDFVKIIPKW